MTDISEVLNCSNFMKSSALTFAIKPGLKQRLLAAACSFALKSSVAVAVCFCTAALVLGQGEDAPSIELINTKLDELQNLSYPTREEASDFLTAHPKQTIPLIMARLNADKPPSEAAEPEGVMRMLTLLSSWAVDPTTEVGRDAVHALEKLSEGTSTVTAIRAQNLLLELMLNYSETVERQLRDSGVIIEYVAVQVLTAQGLPQKILRIDENYHGSPEDLEIIRWLVGIKLINARGASINGPILKQLVKMPELEVLQLREVPLNQEELDAIRTIRNLKTLELLYCNLPSDSVFTLAELPITHSLRLFGSSLSSESVADLKEQLEGVEFIFGRGGFLGIKTNGDSNIIREIVKNGAADLAGLRTEDQIVSINKVPIAKFSEIRIELAKYAPTDKISVDILRRVPQTNQDGFQSWGIVPMNVEVALGMQDL